jgi:hypothetical protein
MLPPEEELLSDEVLREASVEQLENLRSRVEQALRMRGAGRARTRTLPGEQPGEPLPGESLERPALD